MAQSLRVLLFNADPTIATELRSVLLRVPGLKLVAELDEPILLPQAVAQFPIDLVLAHLDPAVDVAIENLQQIIDARPGLPVFALSECTDGEVILRVMRAGIREFLVKPLTSDELTRALGKIKVTGVTSREPGKIISVIGSAGGVGASTVAVNLATELSQLIGAPQRVILVDLDFRFGQIATMLDVQPQFTIADLCESPETLDPQMIAKALVDHPSGVRVLARPGTFVQADTITAAHCVSVLSALADLCDFVVIDGPTRQDPAATTVLDMADANLLVLQLLVTSVRNTDRILQELQQNGFNLERLKLVVNRTDADPGFLELAQVEKTLGRSIFASIPDDWRSVSASINIGQPLHAQWSRSRARCALRQLALQFHVTADAPVEAPSGMLGRLFGGKRNKTRLANGAVAGRP